MNTIKKITASLFVVCSFVFYALYQRSWVRDTAVMPYNANDAAPTTPAPLNQIRKSIDGVFSDDEENSEGAIPHITPKIQPSKSPSPRTNATYKDGTYIGDIADAFYGNIQIKAMIKNGKIVNIIFLDYPQDRRTSININTQAMPMLKEEVIQAQNSNVDVISGATQTSEAFNVSLASALRQAKL